MTELIGLFPVPLLRCTGCLGTETVRELLADLGRLERSTNSGSGSLSHTATLKPSDSQLLPELVSTITPLITDFGMQLFGQRLGWSVKELWMNVLERGGRQAMHNHANSFISGILYLTPVHPDTRTVFIRAPGGRDFVFNNDHPGATMGPYNASRWISPAPAPGDLLLFPSYLLHEVPENPGEQRVTLAMNAIPHALDSWGYRITFAG